MLGRGEEQKAEPAHLRMLSWHILLSCRHCIKLPLKPEEAFVLLRPFAEELVKLWGASLWQAWESACQNSCT